MEPTATTASYPLPGVFTTIFFPAHSTRISQQYGETLIALSKWDTVIILTVTLRENIFLVSLLSPALSNSFSVLFLVSVSSFLLFLSASALFPPVSFFSLLLFLAFFAPVELPSLLSLLFLHQLSEGIACYSPWDVVFLDESGGFLLIWSLRSNQPFFCKGTGNFVSCHWRGGHHFFGRSYTQVGWPWLCWCHSLQVTTGSWVCWCWYILVCYLLSSIFTYTYCHLTICKWCNTCCCRWHSSYCCCL